MNERWSVVAHDDVLAVQDYLVSVATGSDRIDAQYHEMRNPVISNSPLYSRLPAVVKRCKTVGAFWSHVTHGRGTYQERREYIWAEFRPLLDFLESSNNSPSFESANQILKTVNHEFVQQTWHKAIERISSDPEGAITAARTLVESVCIHILEKAGISVDDKWDLNRLFKEASSLLNLSPDQHQESIFKQILGGCSSVVNGFASLRNKFGDAHGKKGTYVKPNARHATLAVNLGGTLATFPVSTYEEKGIRPDSEN